ncbi:plakophilin-3a isoform X1 [Pangasianodon hypophthalmus]|uniref:plakophilin-3a isoform X1 n=2 Tax=Pangasianodon hypophthalmus TaxID=310915 RepID=UPI0023071EB1|nr:plakophilin-3a isoform X1 [Pangasianodon hypophthalmus]
MSVVSEGVFLSALQPNSSTVSTYAVPPETHLPHGGAYLDEAARAKRVQQQVAQRLAEKSTLPRRNPSTSTSASAHYATSEYGGSATMMKYQTYNPSFSSKSYMYSTTRPVMAHRAPQHSTIGYSSRSAMDFGTRSQMSRGAIGGLIQNHEDMGVMAGMGTMGGGYQGSQSQQYQMSTMMRSMNRGVADPETASLHSLRLQSLPQQQVATWMARNGSEGSLGSDQDATYSRQEAGYNMSNGYAATYSLPYTATVSEFSSGARQASATLPSMKHSLSGTLPRNGGTGVNMEEEAYVRQSFKGPSQRTISRITQNRQNRYSMSAGSMQGGSSTGGFVIGGNGSQGNLSMMKQGRISRAPSVRSMISVGKGKDVFDGMDMTGSMGNLCGLDALDMQTAVNYIESPDKDQQALGAAYIQHECYHNKESRKQVNQLKGILPLVQLFNSEAQRVQQYATGAARNLIYENMENKVALIEAGGIPKLMQALKEPDDELQKNITGILWNLSSKDNLKEKLARETLPKLTEDILIPLSGTGERDIIEHNDSEADIFYNTTGCLRNLSSINTATRQHMRETSGLIEALVGYLQKAVDDTRIDGKGVENAVCVLRNLSYQLYDEIPPSVLMRLEGPSRNQASSRGEPIGCFTPQSKKAKDSQNQDLTTFTEVARVPKGCEWLWHPKVVALYHTILARCESNTTTREAAAGALQNITAGERRWPSILSRVALEQERMLPTILDNLKTTSDLELRSLTGFLRNLSRHSRDKNSLAPKVVSHLLAKLPDDGTQKLPSPDVVINICGALNNLVSCSEVATRDIAYFDGLPKLVGIRNSHDNSQSKQKQAKAAATVLCNMFQYKKLHKDYRKKGFQKEDFTELSF